MKTWRPNQTRRWGRWAVVAAGAEDNSEHPVEGAIPLIEHARRTDRPSMSATSSRKVMERIVAGLALSIAFIVMASIFVPHATKADDQSVDPHHGLTSLGSVENVRYIVDIYATQVGPRYTVTEKRSGERVAVLMDADRVQANFPDLPLPEMDMGPTQLMLADPAVDMPRH